MNFGLSGIVPIVLYIGAIAAVLLAIFWRPIVGILYLVPLIPLQTLRYQMNGYPLAASVIPIILLAVIVGLLRRRQALLQNTPFAWLLVGYGAYTFVSLILGTFAVGTPFPMPGEARFGVWEDYINMPVLLILVAAIGPSRRQVQIILLLMCLATLALNAGFHNTVGGRDYSSYSNDLRGEGGGMGYAGVNGLAAFEAACSTLLFALAAYQRNWLYKLSYYGIALFSIFCLMYALSRGAYIAGLLGWLFVGVFKDRKLLVLLLIAGLCWTSLVPPAVQQRVFMTYGNGGDLDHSSELRVEIWQDAMDAFASANALFGMGFNTYAYQHRVGNYEDTHNIFLKVLIEMGLAGIVLFVWLLFKLFSIGFRFSRIATDPLYASLGLGLAGWVLCATVASCFGDRWMYFQVNGFMWVIGGIVAHGWTLLHSQLPEPQEAVEPTPGDLTEVSQYA